MSGKTVINRMIGYGGVPFFEETRAVLLDTARQHLRARRAGAALRRAAAAAGDAVRAVIYEWEIDPVAHARAATTSSSGATASSTRCPACTRSIRAPWSADHFPVAGRRPLDRARRRRQHVDHRAGSRGDHQVRRHHEGVHPLPRSRASATTSARTRTRCASMPTGPHLVHADALQPRLPLRSRHGAVHLLPSAACRSGDQRRADPGRLRLRRRPRPERLVVAALRPSDRPRRPGHRRR